MNPGKLTDEDFQLLREAVLKYYPSLIGLVGLVGKEPLSEEQRETLREALAGELCSTGLRPDDEPNERGIKLDNIIGKLASY